MRPVSSIDCNACTSLAQAQGSGDELTRFERLLLEISTGFINPPAGRFEQPIVDTLRRIVETLDIDRSTLNLMSTARGRIEVAYSYAVPGVERTLCMASGPESWPWAWSMLMGDRDAQLVGQAGALSRKALFRAARGQRRGRC